MTESCAQVATATPDEARRDPTSVGRAVGHAPVRLDPWGRLQVHLGELAPTELVRSRTGELRTRPLTDREGWLTSGDLGEIDDEGRIRITGRATDRIISGGYNVDPLEVERCIGEHRAVADAAVVGLPDPEWGERVAAVVVLHGAAPEGDAGVEDEAHLSPQLIEDLEALLRRRLAPFKRPRRWARAVDLPRTAAGKLDRAAVRDWLQGGGDGEGA